MFRVFANIRKAGTQRSGVSKIEICLDFFGPEKFW